MARRKKAELYPTGEATEEKMVDDAGALEDLHPFVMGLLQELPAPGAYWAPERRQLWLTTATSIFQMIYTEAPPLPPAPAA
jgi:hypothetical protein